MRSKEFYLFLLMDVLIDIRALEDHELAIARIYADIFHNLPGALTRDWTPELEQEVYDYISSKVTYYNLQDWWEALEQRADGSLTYFSIPKQHS